MATTKLKFYILIATIMMMLIAAVMIIDSYIIDKHVAKMNNHVHEELKPLVNDLTFNLNNNFQLIKVLPALFAINPSLSQRGFSTVAKKMLDGSSQLRAIAVAPDLIIKYLYPNQGNEAAIGLNYRMLPDQIDTVNRAINSKQLVLAGPLKLVQGGLGLISRAPIFIEDKAGNEHLMGIVSAVIDPEALYRKSGLRNTALTIDIAIRGKDGLGENGAVFFGDPDLFNQRNILSDIALPNGSWQIAARPKGGWQALPEDIWQTRLYLLLAVLFFFLILFLFLNASMKVSIANLKFKNLIESSPIPYVLMNDKQQVIFLNFAFINTYGYTIKDLPTIEAWRLKAYPNEEYRKKIIGLWHSYVEAFQSSKALVPPVEINIQCKNGATRTALVSLTENEANRSSEYTVVFYDITGRKQAEDQLQVSKHQLENVIDGAQLGYWDWNYKTGEHRVNDRWLSMLGLSRSQIDNTLSDWEKLIHPDDKQSVIDMIQAHIKSKQAYVAEFRMKHVDGHWVWIQGAGAVVEFDEFNAPLRLCGTHQDITARKQIEAKLMLSARVFSDAYEGISITDASNTIVDVNPAFCDITGYSRQDVIGKNPEILHSGRHDPTFYTAIWDELREKGHWQGEVWNRKKSGEVYVEALTISQLLDDHGQVINYISVFTDITDRKKQEEKLSLMAHYDLLTGLPNRALFSDRFHQAIAYSKRTKAQLAVCFLDLDNFKPVNDNYGHDVGDQLLIEVANRITACLRDDDTVSRQGGDEFALLLNDIESYEHCKKTLDRVHHSLSLPYLVSGYYHNISVSTGVTLYPSDDSDIDTLLRHADQAMYQSKQLGRNRYQLFDTHDDQKLVKKHHQLAEIEQALANDEFILYYQPKVNMVTGEIFSVEALIRWFHPKKGLISPLSFLPLLDSTDIEIILGNWVIKQALIQLEAWNKQGITLEVSINIASHHLRSNNFFAQLEQLLAEHPAVNAHALQLEILESSALGELHATSKIIEKIKTELGVHFALDDFGTGYSSLTHLRNLSASTLKIDQSFVRDMLEDPSDYAIIEGVIGLANAFNRKLVAEGVESSDHGLMLIMMGCELAQGYGVARPMLAGDLVDWLVDYEPNQQWISFAKQPRTAAENKVKIFCLVAKYWMERFVSNIESPTDSIKDWPILSGRMDHFGQWLSREQQGFLFTKGGLSRLQKAHDEFHQMAQGLLSHYQQGKITAARAGLGELQLSFERVLLNAKLLLVVSAKK